MRAAASLTPISDTPATRELRHRTALGDAYNANPLWGNSLGAFHDELYVGAMRAYSHGGGSV